VLQRGSRCNTLAYDDHMFSISERLIEALRCTAAVSLLLVVSACGGGISIGFGWGDYDGDLDAPSVSMAASPDPVQAGQSLNLVAAASDWSGIDRVIFYRLDGAAQTLLGSDGSAPYEWVTIVPTDGRTTLTVFARAVDNTGNQADSQVITVTVTP
jgi:hypothetical protein